MSPNVILINCDDLGYGDLGCYNPNTLNSTPHLDRMAADGLRFTDFYMASSVCSPSRGAMLTGCYPPRIGFGLFDGKVVLFPGQPIGLHPNERTIAHLFKSKGYATKIVGKWHCGDQKEFLPTNYGFDSYFGLPYSNDMGRQKGRDPIYPPLPLIRNSEVIQQQPDQAALTERYLQECLDFIRSHREQPFFLYFAHMHVHLPIYTPQHFLQASKNGRYGAAVMAIDWTIGVLRYELKKLNLDRNTLIIFTSDNGSRVNNEGGSNDPLRGTKFSSWEGGFRVPCIMCWPEVIQPGQICRQLVTAMDFLPTFAEILGISLPHDRIIDGKSILPILRNPSQPSPHEFFAYYQGNRLEAVRFGDWKLHIYRKKESVLELYNLREDIGETRNVAHQYPLIIEKIEKDIIPKIREDLGDSVMGIQGKGCRPHGRVPKGEFLVEFDPDYPYFQAEYDLSDAG